MLERRQMGQVGEVAVAADDVDEADLNPSQP
jgi:hypothetical protein